MAREIADRLGATVYASCSLTQEDDLDAWVAALGRSGVDRVACARSPSGEIPSATELCTVHAELSRRLSPWLVLVPATVLGAALAKQVAGALGVEVSESQKETGEAYLVGGEVFGTAARVIVQSAKAREQGASGEDIDVLFFTVEDGSAIEREVSPTT